jgi:hypothetical protein
MTRSLAFLEKASTPPAEERVTFFFARAKKKVIKKESTLRGAPGLTHAGSERLRRWQLRVRRGGAHGWAAFTDQLPIVRSPLQSKCCLTTARVLAPIKWFGRLRANSPLQNSSSEAQNNVLSFGDFSLHGQRKVTRSAVGRVEALELQQSLRESAP